jgi:hypothetical protein
VSTEQKSFTIKIIELFKSEVESSSAKGSLTKVDQYLNKLPYRSQRLIANLKIVADLGESISIPLTSSDNLKLTIDSSFKSPSKMKVHISYENTLKNELYLDSQIVIEPSRRYVIGRKTSTTVFVLTLDPPLKL